MGSLRSELFLVVPPVWELSFQSLGIPTVAAYVRQAGFRIAGRRDLNIEFQHFMAGKRELDVEVVRREWNTLRSSPYYRENYEQQFDPFYSRIDLPFGYTHLVSCNYDRLIPFVRDERVNYPLRFFRECLVAEDAAAANPGHVRVVGFGLDSENQFLSSLTLAREIKLRNPEVLTVMGGPWPTANLKALQEEGELLADIDFLIANKGEIPLKLLMQAVEDAGGKPAAPLPGILVNQGDFFSDALDLDTRVPLGELPRPEVFDPRAYARPNVLPYESERGCYWGKCRFCHHIQHYTHAYNSKPIEKVIAELKAYHEEFPYQVVAFVDAAMPPRRVKEIAEAFEASEIGKRWALFCKMEKSWTRDIFDVAARNGLDVISFGLETVSKRLGEFIQKPMDKDVAYRVMKDCSESGIYTTAGVMTGLPSEKREDLDELWEFLDRIKPFTYLHPQMFKFERGSEFFENAAAYNLEVVPAPPGMRLSPYRHFVDHNGGTTRQWLIEENVNQNWWRQNMKRSLDWKSKGEKFCKAVQFIVDN